MPFIFFSSLFWTDYTRVVFHFFYRARREYHVFQKLLEIVPNFQDRLMESSDEGCKEMASLVRFSLYPDSTVLTIHVQAPEGYL